MINISKEIAVFLLLFIARSPKIRYELFLAYQFFLYGAVMRENRSHLRDFYQTQSGRMTAQLLTQRIHEFWPDLVAKHTLGFGFAAPYLAPVWGDTGVALVGVDGTGLDFYGCASDAGKRAPQPHRPFSVLPFPAGCFDRILLVHALEQVEPTPALFYELWRVLKEDGRLLAVVANSASGWSRRPQTPFGSGRAYDTRSLFALLRQNHFLPERTEKALYIPALASKMVSVAPAFEALARYIPLSAGGVILMESRKQVLDPAIAFVPRKPRKVARILQFPKPAITSQASRNSHGQEGGAAGAAC